MKKHVDIIVEGLLEHYDSSIAFISNKLELHSIDEIEKFLKKNVASLLMLRQLPLLLRSLIQTLFKLILCNNPLIKIKFLIRVSIRIIPKLIRISICSPTSVVVVEGKGVVVVAAPFNVLSASIWT